MPLNSSLNGPLEKNDRDQKIFKRGSENSIETWTDMGAGGLKNKYMKVNVKIQL